MQYHGVSWDTGEVFDESWGKQPFSFTVGSGVVAGLLGRRRPARPSARQVIAVLPPSVAYGDESDTNASDLAGQTLVFVVDILAVAHRRDAVVRRSGRRRSQLAEAVVDERLELVDDGWRVRAARLDAHAGALGHPE